MAQMFTYRAVDTAGEVQTGSVDADSQLAAAERVRRMGLRPVTIKRRRAASLQKEIRIPGVGKGKRTQALALASRQFSTMIDAGTPMVRCLEILNRQTEDKSLALALTAVQADVENGDRLSDALARQPHWFDEFYVAMVRTGEGAGRLGTVLDRLADATERIAELRRKVKSALAYPVAVAGLVVVMLLAMMFFLIPTFEDIYDQLGGTLPLPTRIVLGISGVLTGQTVFIAIAVIVGTVVFRRWARKPAGRRKIDGIKLRLPVFGSLVARTALARFSRTLSVLVSSGVAVTDAFAIARTTSGNLVVADAVGEIVDRVSAGARIADAMEEHEVFAPMVVQMIRVGEESGAIDDMLTRIADLYDSEVNATVENLTALLEPLLIMFMGVSVGVILLAVYLPMFGAIDQVK